jgi:demethylmenaquinone methyltransferase/2-methoxy-6-polyprenyl-1,4-benzoquinol methylase
MWGSGDVAFFDRVAGWYDRLHPTPDADQFLRAFEAADRPVRTVLDLAGGTGRVARVIGGQSAVERTVVLDRSRGMLRRAAGHTDAVQGDAGRLPLDDDSVDAVVCVDALHHLPDRDRALAECNRVLAPGGVLVLVDFDPGTVIGRLVALGEHVLGMQSTFYDRRGAVEAVESSGLTVRAVESGWATYRIVAERPRALE